MDMDKPSMNRLTVDDIKQEDYSDQDSSQNAQQQKDSKRSSSPHVNPLSSDNNKVQGCMNVKKEEKDGDIKVKCKCEECTEERKIKIEFNQTNETANERVNLSGPSNATKGASSQCKRVKKEEEHDEEWDEDCDCDQCRWMRLKAIQLKQANGMQVAEGENSGDDDNETEIEQELDGIEGDYVRNDGNLSVGGQVDEKGEEDQVEFDKESQMSDDDGDDETEIDDEEYEMKVDDEESSDDDETEIDEQSDQESGNQSTGLILKPNIRNTKKKSFKCTWNGCNKKFALYSSRNTHLKHHTGEKLFKCTWNGCEVRFTKKSNFKYHLRIHTGEKPFKCPWKSCGKTFITNTSMTRHHKSHTPELLPKCEHCGKRFTRMSSLKAHIRTHTGEKPFKCPWKGCDTAFSYRSNIQYHLRFHTGEKPFKCVWKDCDKTFIDKSSMLYHHKLHTPEGWHKCEHCGKGFKTVRTLKRHFLTHTGEKPFKCPWKGCDTAFSDKSTMLCHHKSHTPELLPKCEHCGKRFTKMNYLKAHIRTHTGEKPFKCTWKDCHKTFIDRSGMRRHYNRSHEQMSNSSNAPEKN